MTTDHEVSGDCPDDLESVEEEEDANEVGKEMVFKNVLAALKNRNTEMLASLPPAVKRRIKALKKLQLEATNIEAQFFKEVHALECKYHQLYIPLYEKRTTIVNGTYEPTEEESQWPSDDEDDLPNALKEKAKIEEITDKETPKEDVKGIPEFWLTIFRNCSLLNEMVQSHDVPILNHLVDIKTVCSVVPMSFTLEFHFSPNEYFTNEVLKKEYFLKCVPDEDDPFGFEGPEIFQCVGCTINWNKGKNVTLKTIKKKQKHKSRGVVRVVTKTVQNDSFFNFFNPPTVPDPSSEEIDDDLRNLLTTDFEIGHYIRERVVQRAVLYFTGEGIEDEEDFEEEEEDDDDEEEDSEGEGGAGGGKNQEQCKQQ